MHNSKKKIIIIGPAYPYRGGPSTFISYLYNSLKDKFEIKIFNYTLLYPSVLFPGKTQYDESETGKFIVPNQRVVNSISPLNWFTTAKKIKNENADLVVFDWWQPFFGLCHFFISLFLRNQYEGKIVFITENFISHEARFIDTFLTKMGLRNADHFIALSKIVEEDLKSISGKRKIHRAELPPFDLYNIPEEKDIILERNKIGFGEKDKVLLFFGYVRKYKGLDLLIKAMPEVISSNPDVKLLIVGEFYDDPSSYLQIIKELKLEKYIKVINRFVKNEEVGLYYSLADLVILPYRSATQSAVLNVSYSFLKPVIATRVGGLEEFVENEETGFLVKAGSPENLAEGINKFFLLNGKIDFTTNIKKKLDKSLFHKFADIFNRIISQSAQ
ncbi:MAG: glycosyltransferase [Ignavibacteriales bacterium]|nr:MAG: glycosyltransferase [Ignavibacteriales bacterium]